MAGMGGAACELGAARAEGVRAGHRPSLWRLRRVLPSDNFSQQMIISLFPVASCLPEPTDTIRVTVL